MGDLNYTIELPQSLSKDVVTREVHVILNGEETVSNITPDQKKVVVKAKHGDKISIFVVDIDDVENKSEPSDSLEWTAIDTIAPKKPNAPMVTAIEDADLVIEEDTVNETFVEYHEHCLSDDCSEAHEHCSQHVHCTETPCVKVHAHCDKDCAAKSC